MPTIKDYEALDPLMQQIMLTKVKAEMDAGAADFEEIRRETGFHDGAFARGTYYFYEFVSRDPAHFKTAGRAFSYAWCMAERETLRRAIAAISTPGAKGKEIAILQAMLEGSRIDDAVTNTAKETLSEANVVNFPVKRVTDY